MDCSSDLEEVTPLPISLDDPMIVDGPDITQSRDEVVFKHMKALREQPGVVRYYVHKLQEHGIDPHKHEAWFPATVTDDSSSDIKVRCRLCGPQATYTLQNWQQHLSIKKHINRVAKRTEIDKKVLWEGFQKCDSCTTSTTLEGTKEITHQKDCAWNYTHDEEEEPPIIDIPAKSQSKMLTPAELEWAKERARLNKWKAAKAARAARVIETPPVPSSSSEAKDASKSTGSTTLIDAHPSPVSPHREARVPRVSTPSEAQARVQTNPPSLVAKESFRHYKPPAPVSPPVTVAETSDRAHTPPAPSPKAQTLVQPVSNPPTPPPAQTTFEDKTPSVLVSPTPGSSRYHNTCAPVVPPLNAQTRFQPVSSPSSPPAQASLKRKTPPASESLLSPTTDTSAKHKEYPPPTVPSPEPQTRVQPVPSPSSPPAQASNKRKAPTPASSPTADSSANHSAGAPHVMSSPEAQARVQPASNPSSPPAQTSLKRKAPPAPLSLTLTDSSGSYSIYAPPTVPSIEARACVQPVSNPSSPPVQASRKRKAPPAPLSLPRADSSAYHGACALGAMPQHISSLPPSPVTPGFQHQRTPPIPVSPPMVDPSAYQRAYVFMASPESQAHVQLVSRSNRPPPAIPTGFQYHQTHLIPLSTTTRVSNAYHRVVYGPGVPEPPCPQVPLCFQPYLVPRENLPRLRIPLGFRASSGYTLSAPHGQVYADGSVPVMSRKRGFDDSFRYEVS